MMIQKAGRLFSDIKKLKFMSWGLYSLFSKEKQGQLKWTPRAQKAIWAHLMIRCIEKDPPQSDTSTMKILRMELINLKIPEETVFTKRAFDPQIQKDMKSYFTEGVQLNREIFNQTRFEKAIILPSSSGEKRKVIFFPTYLTTGRMFYTFKVQKNCNALVFGRWGIGKSIALVLRKMLGDYIADYLIMENQQLEEYKLLRPQIEVSGEKIIYWSIKSQDTFLRVLRKTLLQLKDIKQNSILNQPTLANLKTLMRRMSKTEIHSEIYQILDELIAKKIKAMIVIDQINLLASFKRRENEKKLKGKEKARFKELEEIYIFLRQLGVTMFCNSSINIQKDLIDVESLKHDGLSVVFFNFEERIKNNQVSCMFQLGQFYAAVFKQYLSNQLKASIDLEISRKLAIQFANYKWQALPNALLMKDFLNDNADKIKKIPQLTTLGQFFTQSLPKLNNFHKNAIRQQIIRFIGKSSGANLQIKNNILKQCLSKAHDSKQVNNMFFEVKLENEMKDNDYINGDFFLLKQKEGKKETLIIPMNKDVFPEIVKTIFTDKVKKNIKAKRAKKLKDHQKISSE